MIVHEQIEEFDERNLVLQATLGALAAGRRLDSILDRHAPARPPFEGRVEDVDDLLAAVLGAISVRLAVGRIVDETRLRASDVDRESPASKQTSTAQWLR